MSKCNRIGIFSSRFFKRSCFVIFIIITWSWIKPSKPGFSKHVIKAVNHVGFLDKKDFEFVSKNVKNKTNILSKIVYRFKVGGMVIVSSLRSGSSFLGQLFNQNPSVFYFFEPLFPLHDSCQIDKNEKVDILSSIFSCDLTASKKYIDRNTMLSMQSLKEGVQNKLHVQRRITNLKKSSELSLCFPFNTKALCRTKSCANVTNCLNCIAKLHRKDVEKQCNSASLVVVKTVRTCQLSLLQRVQEKLKERLKVIHLVRDPRAVGLSRLEMHHFTGNIAKEMGRNCKIDRDLFRKKNQTRLDGWNDEDYTVIRYEDLVVDPVGFLQNLSERLRIKLDKVDFLHDDVMSWLKNNTRLTSGSRYSTSRNSLEQVSKWRRKIPMSVAMDIQKACDGMMRLFGYVPVHTADELRNTSIALLSPAWN